MSDGNEFQRSDAATGNVRRPTVVSRNGGTNSWYDDADRSRQRLGRSATRHYKTAKINFITSKAVDVIRSD